jgi:hypothetical protein
MEPARYAADINRLRESGWTCAWSNELSRHPHRVLARYPWLPQEYVDFVVGLEEFASRDETRWILAPSDFDISLDHAFSHDAWETISIEAAEDDSACISSVTAFWNAHIPVFFDVSDGYAYHAIRVSDRSGVVVSGREPEFEDSAEIAFPSFSAFLAHLS